MNRPADYSDLIMLSVIPPPIEVIHVCGKAHVKYIYSSVHPQFFCVGCQQSWRPRVLSRMTTDEIGRRFFVKLPAETETELRLAWVTEGGRRFTRLTKLPKGTPGVEPFTEADW